MAHNFKELIIWRDSIELTIDILNLTRKFSSEEKSLGNQMIRSAVSIPSNIAEGSAYTTPKKFQYYLDISLGSSFELESQLIIAARLNLGEHDFISECISRLNSIQRRIRVFRKTLQN